MERERLFHSTLFLFTFFALSLSSVSWVAIECTNVNTVAVANHSSEFSSFLCTSLCVGTFASTAAATSEHPHLPSMSFLPVACILNFLFLTCMSLFKQLFPILLFTVNFCIVCNSRMIPLNCSSFMANDSTLFSSHSWSLICPCGCSTYALSLSSHFFSPLSQRPNIQLWSLECTPACALAILVYVSPVSSFASHVTHFNCNLQLFLPTHEANASTCCTLS